MNRIYLLVTFLILSVFVSAQTKFYDSQYIYKNKVAIGSQSLSSNPDGAWLMVGDSATTKGMILPRVQHLTDITTPRRGMLIYCIDSNKVFYRTGSAWVSTNGTGALVDNQRFGQTGGDTSATENRYFNLHNLYRMKVDSAGDLYLNVHDSLMLGLVSASAKLYIPNITYNSGADLVALAIDTLTNRVYRKTASGGSTPTLQQVVNSGNSISNSVVRILDASAIRWDVDGDGTYVDQFNDDNTNMVLQNSSNGSGIRLDFSAITGGSLKKFKLREGNGTGTDTLATLYDVRAGGSGGSTANINIGSGYRILKPDGQEIKTLFNGYAVGIDSSSNTNGLTLKADTTLLTTKASRDKLKDSLQANIDLKLNKSDTSIANSNTVSTNARLQKIVDSLGSVGALSNSIYAAPWYSYYIDITGSSLANGHVANVGTGSSITRGTAISNWIGNLIMTVGTSTTGFCYYHYGNSGGPQAVVLDNAVRYNFGNKVRLEDLSDGTDTYHVMSGFADDNHDIGSVVDAVCFRYTSGDSSGKWICHTESNNTVTESTGTATGTSVTVAADTDYDLEITIFGGTAYFYINKALVTTISTNIPTGTARATGMSSSIRKSAGTTSRIMYIEYLAYGKRSY